MSPARSREPAGWGRPTAGAADAPDGEGRRRLTLVAAGLLVLLLGAVVLVLALEHRDRGRLADVQSPTGPAMTAAREAGRRLFSYDAARDADAAAALRLTTSPYTARYRDAAQRVLRPALDGATVVADVRQVGATRATTADRLVALVLLDRTTTRAGAPAQVERQQLRMTLVQRDGSWRVSGVEQL